MAKGQSESLSFRLGGAQLERLAAAAAERNMSPDLLAREFVVAALQDEGRREVLQRLEEIQSALVEMREVSEKVDRLRGDVAVTLETILLNVTRSSEAEVKAFVSRHLRS